MHLILDWRVLRHPFQVQVYKRLLILETLCFRGASSILSCKAVLNPFACQTVPGNKHGKKMQKLQSLWYFWSFIKSIPEVLFLSTCMLDALIECSVKVF